MPDSYQVYTDLTTSARHELQVAISEHSFLRAAGLVSLLLRLLESGYNHATSLLVRTQQGQMLERVLLEGLEALHHHAPISKRQLNMFTRNVQMMQPARVGGQVIALEIAAGMLESGEAEQAHMVLQTAAQIAQQETKFVLMASAAKLRYSQWLHFCKAANRGSPNSGDWALQAPLHQRDIQELWSEAKSQLSAALQLQYDTELVFLLVHLNMSAKRLNQALDLALDAPTTGTLDTDFHALKTILLETAGQPPERLAQAFLDILKCSGDAVEAIWGLLKLEQHHTVAASLLVEAFCLHLDNVVEGNTAHSVAIWSSFAGVLVKAAEKAVAEDVSLEGQLPEAVIEWNEVNDILQTRADWWTDLHFPMPFTESDEVISREEIRLVEAKGACSVFMLGSRHAFPWSCLNSLDNDPEAAATIWHAVFLYSQLHPDQSMAAVQDGMSEEAAIAIEGGKVDQLPKSWWETMPHMRRKIRQPPT